MAVPLKLGQKMTVESVPGEPLLHWKSYDDKNTIWVDASFTKKDLTPIRKTITTTDSAVLDQLQRILHYSRKMNPAFFAGRNHNYYYQLSGI